VLLSNAQRVCLIHMPPGVTDGPLAFHSRHPDLVQETRWARRDRDVTTDDSQRSSHEIRDAEIDIPSYLKDR
jgi:hypothetical protein